MIESSDAEIVLERDASGRTYLYDKRVQERINPVYEKFYNMEMRLRDLDRYGIDLQVLTIPVPGVDRFGPKLGAKLARIANDGIAEFVTKHPNRAVGLACLPMIDVGSALDEFDRAISQLGLRGIGIYSNILGKPLDSPEFLPVYEKAEKYDVPIYVHPNVPITSEAIGHDYDLALIFGWPFDTTLAMARVVLGGVLERCPKAKFVFAHGGGMIPFFGMRIESIFSTAKSLGKTKLPKTPSEYFKSTYVDGALHYPPAIKCAMSFFGPNRVVFATDYPFGPAEGTEFLKLAVSSVNELDVSEDEKTMIFEKNAAQLLKI